MNFITIRQNSLRVQINQTTKLVIRHVFVMKDQVVEDGMTFNVSFIFFSSKQKFQEKNKSTRFLI